MKRLAGGTLLLLIVGAFGFASTSFAATQQVDITGTAAPGFSPANFTIQVGDSVTWTKRDADGIQHTVTKTGGTGSQTFTRVFNLQGESHTIPFNGAGTYIYQCDRHPNTMKASFTVEEAVAEPSPDPTEPPPPPPPPPPSPRPSPTPPPPSPSPSPEPSPTEEATETVVEEESPTSTVTTQALDDIDESDDGGMSTPLKIALVALGLAGVAGGGLYWMHRSSRAEPDIAE